MAVALPIAVLALLPASPGASAANRGAATAPAVAQSAASTSGALGPGGSAASLPSGIHLRGLTLDTSRPVPAPSTLAAKPTGGQQLRLVQFAGPVRPKWYQALTAVGRVVGYLPDNAYLVWTDGSGARQLDAQVDADPALQYSGPFDPAYRLSPDLSTKEQGQLVDVSVQTVSGAEGDAEMASVTQGRQLLAQPYELMGLRTVSVRVPVAQLDEIASLPAVLDVEPYTAPVMNDEAQDQLLAGNVTTNAGKTVPTGPGYLAWLAAHGFPQTPLSYPKVVVVDDGIDNGSTNPLHPDFHLLGVLGDASRLTSNDNCTTDVVGDGKAGHGNLNAGIVGGYNNGSGAANVDANGYHYGLGVSPYGRVGGVKIFSNAGSFDLSACGGNVAGVVQKVYNAGAGLASNSWGANVGGAYTTDAQAYDALTRDASAADTGNQELLEIFSAGNSGSGANTLGSPGTAKNVLTVGATENVRDQGTVDGCGAGDGDNDSDIASFSSRGPTDDGRVKPDVVAAGTHVQGPASQDPGFDGSGVCGPASGLYYPTGGQTLYTWSSGTSHSAPAVAGAVSLIQQYYGRVLTAGATASPAMLKALTDNVPRYLAGGVGTGDTLPSNAQGFGVPDLSMLFDPTTHRALVDQSTLFDASGQSWSSNATVGDPGKPVRVSLAWTDAPGATVGAAYVNNLDLTVIAGGKTYLGNVFTNGLSVTGGAADPRNNVENVFLPAGTTGPVRITVKGTNIAGDGVPGNGKPLDQDFALTAGNLDLSNIPVGIPMAGGLTVHDSDFDANTTYDPGETLTVDAAISNVGDGALGGGSGTLQVMSGGATIVQGTSGYPTIPGDSATQNLTQYVVHIDDGVACGSTVVLRHTYTVGTTTVTQDQPLLVGAPAVPSSTFTTTTSADVPKAIPDNNATGASSTLTLPAGTPVGAIRVGFTITHTWDGDLSGTLTSPTGTVVQLFARPGGALNGGDDMTNTVLRDDAVTPMTSGTAPYTGSFTPVQPLSTYQGEVVAGTWKLTVTDGAVVDTGTLQAWHIDEAPLLPAVCAPAGPSVRIAPPAATPENAGPIDVAVTLLHADAATHTVTFTPTAGTATAPADFDATPITVVWHTGDPATKHLGIPVVDDGVVEGDQTLTVEATASDVPVSAGVTAIIQDPLSTIGVADAPAVTEGGGPLSFPVTLAFAVAGSTYTVHVATSNGTATGGSDYTAVSQTLTWNPGDAATKQVLVPVLDDGVHESAETVHLSLDSPTGTSNATQLGASTATGTINDDDAAAPTPAVELTLDKAKTKEGDHGKHALQFTVSLSAPSNQAVSFQWKTADKKAKAPGDYKAAHGSVVIAAGATTATFKVKIVGDRLKETSEKFKILTSGLTGAGYAGKTSTTGQILNDD